MKWSTELQALQTALRSQEIIPHLLRRLSLENIEPTEIETRRIRNWALSLKKDPGWAILELNLNQPHAFPKAYHQALQAGFSSETDHHHALIFENFSRRALEKNNLEFAEYAIIEWFDAWNRLSKTSYICDLIEKINPSLSEEEIDEVKDNFLTDIFPDFVNHLNDPAGLHSGRIDPHSLRFLSKLCTKIAFRISKKETKTKPYIRNLHLKITAQLPEISARVKTKFLQETEHLDLSKDKEKTILAPFLYLREYFEIVGPDATISQTLISNVVEICWSLRKLDRDDDNVFSELLKISDFFNRDLIKKLSEQNAFGHNSTCADFLVFQGEQEIRPHRQSIFELGLEICPGHRNSSLLLSYEYLFKIDAILLKTAPIPSARMMVKWGTQSIKEMLEEADRHLKKAEDIYAFNEKLDAYKKRVRNEKGRLGIYE